MKKKKSYYTRAEWLTIIQALNDMRSRELAEGKCVDFINDTIQKVVAAKTKRVKVAG